MRKAFIATSLALVTTLSHASVEAFEGFTVTTQEITPTTKSVQGLGETTPSTTPTTTTTPTPAPTPAPAPTTTPVTPDQQLERAGKIISTAKDMVAFGEAIYTLVQKGKPSNTTEYAPISVAPKDPTTKEVVDAFEMENFSMPVAKKFETVIKKGLKEVVRFQYKVMYSYGGSYNGKGKYLTSVLVVPTYVKTSFGWTFNASMKLGGMMNNGTKTDPVAGVVLAMKYQMNSWTSAMERNDTIYINGRGELKSYIGQ